MAFFATLHVFSDWYSFIMGISLFLLSTYCHPPIAQLKTHIR